MDFLKQQRVQTEITPEDLDSESLLTQSDFQLNEDYIILQSLWRTEMNAPELLPYCPDLVEAIKQTLETQQTFIDSKADERKTDEHFTITIYQSEIERTRFLLVNYLRVRLHKIESQAHYIINSQTELEKLSEAEQRYLNKLLDLNNDHIDQTITSRLGNEAKSLYNANDDFAEHGRPVMSKFVFCQALDLLSDIEIAGADHPVTMAQGAVMIAQYSSIQEFVQGGQIQLL